MDITNVFTAFIAFLMAVVSAFVIPWLRRKIAADDTDDLGISACSTLWMCWRIKGLTSTIPL